MIKLSYDIFFFVMMWQMDSTLLQFHMIEQSSYGRVKKLRKRMQWMSTKPVLSILPRYECF